MRSIKYIVVICFVLLSPSFLWAAACSSSIAQGSTETCGAITKNGITWTFHQDYTVGQFVNGDYWVIDAGSGVTIDGVSPVSSSSSSPVENGSMINPDVSDTIGFDSDIPYHTYSGALNVAADVDSESPLIIHSGDSLVSSDSAATTCGVDGGSYVQAMAVLTCLSSQPSSGSFRPPYTGTTKTIHNISEVNYSRLGKIAPEDGAPSLATVEGYFEDFWWDLNTGWQTRSLHPCDNQPDYGAVMARYISQGALLLNTNISDSQKYTLLVRMIQYAIDLSAAIAEGAAWPADGGHGLGRKSALSIGAFLLNDATMKAQLNATNYFIFGEDQHTWYITEDDWGRDVDGYDGNGVTYNSTDHPLGTPEWGRNHVANPSMDDSRIQTYYRNYFLSQLGGLTAARIMGAQSIWNRDTAFDYIERIIPYLPCTLDCSYNATAWELAMYNTYWGSCADGACLQTHRLGAKPMLP